MDYGHSKIKADLPGIVLRLEREEGRLNMRSGVLSKNTLVGVV